MTPPMIWSRRENTAISSASITSAVVIDVSVRHPTGNVEQFWPQRSATPPKWGQIRPSFSDLALAFEATRNLDPHEQQLVKELIEAVLLKHDAKRWTTTAAS